MYWWKKNIFKRTSTWRSNGYFSPIISKKEELKMVGGPVELCGFLDAKLPGGRYMGQRVRKRSLAPWKVWRRHWCSIRKLGPGLGIEVQLDRGVTNDGTNVRTTFIKVSSDSIICRSDSRTKQFAYGIFTPQDKKPLLFLSGNSETETQRWIANIRELLRPRRHRFLEGSFNISMVDNAHARNAGLSGLYGDLIASQSGIFVKEVHSGEIIETFNWIEMSQFHLTTAGRPEDVKRICVIHTTKEFRAGIGELQIFCMNAEKLLQSLVTQGRGPKHKTAPSRPLSRSEGDLRFSIESSDDSGIFTSFKSKVATSLMNAGIGLLITSRSGSEAKLLQDYKGERLKSKTLLKKMKKEDLASHLRAVDNDYQFGPANNSRNCSSLEDLADPDMKRASRLSVASGIYEEITDDFIPKNSCSRIHSKLYENPEDIIFSSIRLPPPLPPRKRCASSSTRNGSISDDGLDSEGDTRSATPNTQEDATSTPEEKPRIVFDESDYVPMSPRPKDIALLSLKNQSPSQEDIYMVMR